MRRRARLQSLRLLGEPGLPRRLLVGGAGPLQFVCDEGGAVMTVVELVQTIREAGIAIEFRAGKIWLKPRQAVTSEIEAALTHHRARVIWALVRRLPGYPLNEIWLRPENWQRWMEMCGEGVEKRSYDEAA